MTSTQFPAIPDPAHLRPELAPRLSVGYARIGDVDLPTPQLYLGDYPAGTSFTTPGDQCSPVARVSQRRELQRAPDPQGRKPSSSCSGRARALERV